MPRAFIALVVCCVSGCFYPADRGRALEARVDRIQGENEQLKADVKTSKAELDAQVPRIDQKLAEVSATLETLDKASRRSDADIGVQVQRTVEDVAVLRGQVETYLHRISELETQLQTVQEATAKSLTEMKGADAMRAAEEKRKAEELQRPTDKKEFLKLAQDKALAKEYGTARQLFAEWLKKWPREELAGEANFGIGKTLADEDKCREALPYFGRVIQDHAKTRSAPAAYLHSSECFAALKMAPESRLALEELVKTHPKSDAARTAKTRLDALDRKPAAGKKTK